MAGYSGTPLAKKLGLKEGQRALILGAPVGFDAATGRAASTPISDGPLDYVHVFESDRAALERALPGLAARLTDAGLLWISWPKKASKRPTTIDEAAVRALGLATGLVDVKVCAVDEIWSGLKFVRRLRDRERR